MTPARIARAQGPSWRKRRSSRRAGALPPEADTEAEAYWSMEQLRGRRAVQPEAAAYEAPAGEAASGAPDMRTMAMLEPELTAGPFFPAEPAAETLPAEPEQAALHEDVPPVRTKHARAAGRRPHACALHRRAKRR